MSDLPLWKQVMPIRSPWAQVYIHEDREWYHVGRAVAEINARPEKYQFQLEEIARFRHQLQGYVGVDINYIKTMSDDDMWRPVLIGILSDGMARLLDGYHRATRVLQLGHSHIGAWILTPEQTRAIMLSREEAEAVGVARIP